MNLTIAWLGVDVAALVYFWKVCLPALRQGRLAALCALPGQTASRLPKSSVALLVGVGVILALVAVVALLSPPNTWDAMAYHMPRVVYWIQNRSVAFYSTPDLRQLYMPPWAEFAMLQVHILWGGDGLDNLVQWWSLLGSVVGVTFLAQCMGAGYRGQVLAAVVCVTVPQGILEASGAKNNYVTAFWLVALAYYLFRLQREATLTNTFAVGGALGLAWLTKGTAYVFSVAMLCTWVLALPWKAKTVWLTRLPLVVAFALMLNAAHFVRNYCLYGSPLGPSAEGAFGEFRLTNDEITIAALVSNLLRNVSLHLGTPLSSVNLIEEKRVETLIRVVGDDPNSPRTTWSGTTFHVPEMSRHEALAGNPIHLVLILVTLALMLGGRHLPLSKGVVMHVVGLVLGFVLFCALLRWQPWHTRLHLPLFVLWSAAIGVILTRVWRPSLTNGLGVLLLLMSAPSVVANQLRPLALSGEFSILGQERSALYFAEHRGLQDAYQSAAQFVTGRDCQHVGLDSPLNSPVYPMLRLLDADKGMRRVRYVDFGAPSARYGNSKSGFMPCAVICLDCPMTIDKWMAYLSRVGPATVFQNIVVFSAKAPPSPDGAYAQPSPRCTLTFVSGWHGWERAGLAWWRWTHGRGEIRLYTARDNDMVMRGEISSLRRSNKADIFVNGEKIVTWEITWDAFRSFEPLPLSLKAGENSLVFASHDRAMYIPTDSRPLALAVKNLLIMGADGATVCELQP
ncbi:MAG: hypothetical protein ACRERE_35750 [Candidatus Entotheonellia bacterium]